MQAKTIEKVVQRSTSALDKPAPPLDELGMVEVGRRQVVESFVTAITPHQVQQRVTFYIDSKLPQLETAVTYVKVGNYDDALKVTSDAVALAERSGLPTKVLAKAYWNRGLIYEYSGQFQPARGDVKKAFELANDDDMAGELHNIDVAERDAAKLLEQGATATANNGDS